MDTDVATTLITSAAGLGGVTLGAGLNGSAQARERRAREVGDLRAALADLGHVFEGLAFELRLQPRQRPRLRRINGWLSRVAPELELPTRELGVTVAMGPVSIWLVSPQRLAERFDRLTAAMARLAQLAPTSLMDRVQDAIDLIGEFPSTGDERARAVWDARWRDVQHAIGQAGAEAIELASRQGIGRYLRQRASSAKKSPLA